MPNAHGRSIDTTHLSVDQAEERGFIHRDYLAHCLRWTHVARDLNRGGSYKTARVLDIGCGVDVPLARMLYSMRYIIKEYVGLEYNDGQRLKVPDMFLSTGRMPVHLYGGCEFPGDIALHGDTETTSPLAHYRVGEADPRDLSNIHELPTHVVCLEVLEHVEPAHQRKLLAGVLNLMQAAKALRHESPTFFLSTPCWDPQVGAADNHVSEVRYEALGALLEDLGFAIDDHFGTFASMKDYKHHFIEDHPSGKAIWDRLSAYYDTNYLATILAPLYPSRARNCLWRLKVANPDHYTRKFRPLTEVSTPWTHSNSWKELAG